MMYSTLKKHSISFYFFLLPCIARICTRRMLADDIVVRIERYSKKREEQDIQDVNHIKFETNGFPDRIPGDDARFGHASIVQDLLSTDGWVIV